LKDGNTAEETKEVTAEDAATAGDADAENRSPATDNSLGKAEDREETTANVNGDLQGEKNIPTTESLPEEKDGKKADTVAAEVEGDSDVQEEESTPATEDSPEKKDSKNENKVTVETETEKDSAGQSGSSAVEEVTVEQQKPAQLLFPAFTKSVNCRQVLVFLQKSLAILAPANPELGFKLYLEIATAADRLALSASTHFPDPAAEFTSIAYDFMTQSFLVYEDSISEGAAQVRSITAIVGTLLSSRTFERTDYEALITKTAQFAARLLKKPDQCRMVCQVSRLFYLVREEEDATPFRNPQRVLECLQRGLKIADACSMTSSSNIRLFVEILDYYVYYYEIGNPAITDKYVSGLIALINEHFGSIAGTSPGIGEARSYYEQILDQIRKKKLEKSKERFALIVC